MSSSYIKIVGDELWFDGRKIGTLIPTSPSVDAAVRSHLARLFADGPVRDWKP